MEMNIKLAPPHLALGSPSAGPKCQLEGGGVITILVPLHNGSKVAIRGCADRGGGEVNVFKIEQKPLNEVSQSQMIHLAFLASTMFTTRPSLLSGTKCSQTLNFR